MKWVIFLCMGLMYVDEDISIIRLLLDILNNVREGFKGSRTFAAENCKLRFGYMDTFFSSVLQKVIPCLVKETEI